MATETQEHVNRYLEGVDYPASKDDLVSTARSNDAPRDFIKRLVDLPITEYLDPERVGQALDALRPPASASGRVADEGERAADESEEVAEESEAVADESEGVGDDFRERVMEAIRTEWDERRPSGSVGTVDSKDIYERLVAEGVDVPRGAMARTLEKLRDEGRISGAPYHAPTEVSIHGAWSIIEPGWERL